MTPEQARRNREIQEKYILPELAWDDEVQQVNGGKCVKCDIRDQVKRSLCSQCYQQIQRDEQAGIGHDKLEYYPTQEYRKNVKQHIRWALEYNWELLKAEADLAGYELTVKRQSTFGAPKSAPGETIYS